MRIRVGVLIVLLALYAHGIRAATPVDFTLNLADGGVQVPVQFRAWIPDNVDRLRGIVLNLPGTNGDTRNVTTNGTFQARLPGMGFGIVGLRDVLGFTDVSYWGLNTTEAHANLQLLLDTIASKFAHPEIGNAPVLADGISKGGISASYLTALVPERVIGYVADKGFGGGSTGYDPTNLSRVPGLLISGSGDTTVPPIENYFNFLIARTAPQPARLALEIDWNVGHSATNPNARFAFMDQAIRVRYPKGQLPSLIPGNPFPLINGITDPWLGDSNFLTNNAGTFDSNSKFLPSPWPQVASEHNYVVPPTADPDFSVPSWLPNKAMALVYRAQNDSTFSVRPLQINIVNATNGNVGGGQAIDVQITLSSLLSDHIELYHESELVAVFSQTSGTREFFYTPTENGLHTFIAIATYASGASVAYTSNYAVVGASGVPEPVYPSALLLAVTGATLVLRRTRRIG